MRRELFTMAVCVIILSGCAAPEKVQVKLFYPPPPELPRLQWLANFTGEKDIEGEKSGFEAYLTGEKESGKRLDKPYGVALWYGKIYVCDSNSTVFVFDLDKKTYSPMEGATGPGRLLQPINIEIDEEGNKYVTDTVRLQVAVFDRDDRFVKAFGKPGTWRPVDAVPFEDKLYVSDIKNGVIWVLDKKTGRELKRIGKDKENPSESLGLPTDITFDKDGMLYVSDDERFQVVKFDRDGHNRGAYGQAGQSPGHFARPKGLATDRENRLYVVDAAFDNVQLFTGEGQLLFWFGHFGKAGRLPGEFYLPAKVAVDYKNVKYFQQYADPNFEVEYLVFVVNQFGDRMVQVFGFGKEKGKKYPSDEEAMKLLKEELKSLPEMEKREKPEEKKGK